VPVTAKPMQLNLPGITKNPAQFLRLVNMWIDRKRQGGLLDWKITRLQGDGARKEEYITG